MSWKYDMLITLIHCLTWDKRKLNEVNIGKNCLHEPSAYLEAIVWYFLHDAWNQLCVDLVSPVRNVIVVLVEGVNVDCLLSFTAVFWYSVVAVDRAPDAYSDFFLASCFVSILNLPDVVVVAHSVDNLVIVLNEWVLVLQLPSLCNILRLAIVEEWVIDWLCFPHKWPNSIDCCVVIRLVLECSFTNCLEVQDILLFFVLVIFRSTFVNENLVFPFLDFNVPWVVWLGCTHDCRSNYVSGEDIGFVLLN